MELANNHFSSFKIQINILIFDIRIVYMKSILLKLDEKLLEETEVYVKELKISRNNYIKKAVERYNKLMDRKKLEKELAYESFMVREESMEVYKAFESTLNDGLKDEY